MRPHATPIRCSFHVYMAHKELKLREQFEAQAMGQGPASDVFRGVTIHVNGYTVRLPVRLVVPLRVGVGDPAVQAANRLGCQ